MLLTHSISEYYIISRQTCRLCYFYALFIAEVGADRPFLKAVQVGDPKCQNCLLPLFYVLQNKKACAINGLTKKERPKRARGFFLAEARAIKGFEKSV